MLRTSLIAVACAAAVIALAACGGGGGGSGERPSVHHDIVGVDQGLESFRGLPSAGARGGVAIRYGTRTDGVGRDALVAYLTEAGATTARWYDVPPDIRVIGPSTAREKQLVTEVVEAINLSLPPEHRIKLRTPVAGLSLRHTVNAAGRYFRGRDHRPNTIHIEFLDCHDYHDCGTSGATAWGNGSDLHAYVQMARGTPAYGRDDWARILLAHELLHTLLADEHVSERFDSINLGSNAIYAAGPASILKPIDREALQALYGHLELHDSPTALGPWSSTSTHFIGDGRHADFGVALRNGYAEPWARGARPSSTLANNRALLGTVIWDGALVGFSGHQSVTGDALISVDLTVLDAPLPELDGSAVFTALEYWHHPEADDPLGGSMWGDGDLAYTITVDGNTFRETGGDDGRLTGIFTGRSHEGAAGTLERSDLIAAFGASR